MRKVLVALLLLPLACSEWRSCHGPVDAGIEISSLPIRSLGFAEACEVLWQPKARPAWRAPSPHEQEEIRSIIPQIMESARTGTIPSDLPRRADAIGMTVERWRIDEGGTSEGFPPEHIVLMEAPGERRGAGAYLFASGRGVAQGEPWILLQAPHAYHDVGTGRIALRLYLGQAAAKAFFTNTLHRHTQGDGTREEQGDNPADAAHNPDHLLAVATGAVARPGLTLIQLHGFAFDGSAADPPVRTQVVVGGAEDAGTVALAARLGGLLGEGVLIYPNEIQVLGGTTNVERRALVGVPGARFIHLEMAPDLRKSLEKEPELLRDFGTMLAEAR